MTALNPAQPQSIQSTTRRRFLAVAGGSLLLPSWVGCAGPGRSGGPDRLVEQTRIRSVGPGSRYTPSIRVAFVRRKGEYGMRWPGAVYDGEAALRQYRADIEATGRKLNVALDIRAEPIYSPAETEAWVAEGKAAKPDGLLVVLLDRQEHAWPTAAKAQESGIPTVVFAPVGAAFTTNTARLAHISGVVICSTSDFGQAAFGMKMIAAGARLREMRYVVLAGNERKDTEIKHFGTKLRYVPAQTFLDDYNRTPTNDEVRRIATEYTRHAERIHGTAFDDVCNGVKSYLVARTILEREDGDGITMDCLGALGRTKASLPCIAWSRMLDHGVPAACEADRRACITHALVQYLFDRPGFQQDPVPETARNCLIGAHCSCATRLNGFDQPAEPYHLSYHHGKRDAVPVTHWRIGQRMTVVDAILSDRDDTPPGLIISAGTVVENVAVPPAGGCVVSVMVELDGVTDTLDYPGFHQLFVYGDYKKELTQYCQLFGITPNVV